MAQTRKKRNKKSRARRRRILQVYFYRLLFMAAAVFVIIALFRAVARIFRPSGYVMALREKEEDYDAGEASMDGRRSWDPQSITDTITVDGGGGIRAESRESFDESMLSAGDYESAVRSEIEAYEKVAGENSVRLDSFKVKDGVATGVITYAGAPDYRAFNGTEFYWGEAAALAGEGVHFERELLAADGSGRIIEAGDVKTLSDEGLMVIVTRSDMAVNAPGDIAYISSDVRMTGKRSVECYNEDGYSYIVYKKPLLPFL